VIVPHAVDKKDFVKQPPTDRVKLLFVGSANIAGDFELKGGKEALEAFVRLRQKYNNLEMVVRSDIPEEIKTKYTGINGLRIIDKVIPWQEMEQEFQTADIFLFPGHHTPFMSLLDAMSYELPIVTTNAYANAELVTDGRTGLVINCSKKVPYYLDKYLPDGSTPKFRKAIQVLDNDVVTELVAKTSLLIENAELRQKMGKAGREEVEHGRFSIGNRNEKLKRIFDEAASKHK
jgi:glycosyltransferase involved in cell wall biosynthesis